MKARVEKDELALKEQEKEWKTTNKYLIMRVEMLRKEKVEKNEEHVSGITEVITEVKGNVVVVVWEAMIKIVEDVANS